MRSLEKKDEVVANVIWRFLELRGYVSLPLSNNFIFEYIAREAFS